MNINLLAPGDKVGISLYNLYIGIVGLVDGDEVETEYGYIDNSEENYFDFYTNDGELACCDGETCTIIHLYPDERWKIENVELQSENSDITFKLNGEEFEKCAFEI